MSKTLAISKRPRKFSDVLGHTLIKQALMATRIKNRIPNSILFHGTSGSGKTTLARIYAMYINCENVKADGTLHEPCGECDSCKSILTEKAIDFREINAADQRGIDDMRNLKESTFSKPMDLSIKVFIIDEAQQLPKASQNLLLKVLENEKGNNCFMFCTTNADKLEEPLINRCMRFDLKKMKFSDSVSYLEKICNEEGITHEPGALSEIMHGTDGSLRDALNTLEKCTLAANGEIITAKMASSFSKIITLRVLIAIMDNIINKNTYNTYKVSEVIDENGYPVDKVFSRMIAYLSDMMIYRQTKTSDLLQFDEEVYVGRVKDHSEIIKDTNVIRSLIYCLLDKCRFVEQYPDRKHLLNLGFSECIDIVSKYTAV